ncbi:MAG TPA: hypothetical protein VIS27_08620, partial [Yeosuana sp.]
YYNGYKEGIYKQYYPDGKLKVEGNHKLNEKEGNEIHYDESGNQINEIKYKKGKLLKSKSDSSMLVDVPNGMIENVPVHPDCEKFLGNKARKKCMYKAVSEFVSQKFNTSLMKKYGITSGKKIKINVFFKINKQGKVVDVNAKSPLPALTEEAIRVINLLPLMKPGQQRGKFVVVPYSLPIVFVVQ